MDINSEEYYNDIASNYNNFLIDKDLYLRAVEREICKTDNIKSYLDIACGDATRSLRIVEVIKPDKVVLIDESKHMIERARFKKNLDLELVNMDFFDYHSKITFDMITCLWNVFGHLVDKNQRLNFLIKIHSLMSNNGVLFIDINNRYNIDYYGFKNVFLNIVKNILGVKNVGSYNLKASNGLISKVYIHKPNEFDKLINLAGFQIIEKKYFNYETGAEVDSSWRGQIFYKLTKKK